MRIIPLPITVSSPLGQEVPYGRAILWITGLQPHLLTSCNNWGEPQSTVRTWKCIPITRWYLSPVCFSLHTPVYIDISKNELTRAALTTVIALVVNGMQENSCNWHPTEACNQACNIQQNPRISQDFSHFPSGSGPNFRSIGSPSSEVLPGQKVSQHSAICGRESSESWLRGIPQDFRRIFEGISMLNGIEKGELVEFEWVVEWDSLLKNWQKRMWYQEIAIWSKKTMIDQWFLGYILSDTPK